jgi:hypothetical protein
MTTEVGTTGFVIISTTPYGIPTSWLNTDLIQRRAEMPWVGYHNWSTLDNPFIDHTAIERSRLTMNEQIIIRDVLGVYTSIDGLIYPEFSRSEDSCKPFKIPEHWPIFAGFDYGFTDPTAILILAKDPEKGVFYVIDEFYKSKGSLQEHQEFLEKWRGKRQADSCTTLPPWVTAPSFSANPYEPSRRDNEVEAGITRITRLVKSDRLKVFNTCQNLLREMESYVYAEGKNKPAHDNSHSPDALRYAFSKDLTWDIPGVKAPVTR